MKEVILFCILSSFLLQERSLITAEDVRVSIEPQKKEVVVEMKNMLNLAYNNNEKEMVNRQLRQMRQQNFEWSTTMDAFHNKSLKLIVNKKNIDARINFQYTDEKDLLAFGITTDSTYFHLLEINVKPISEAKMVDEINWGFPKNKRIEFKDVSLYNWSLTEERLKPLRIDPGVLKTK